MVRPRLVAALALATLGLAWGSRSALGFGFGDERKPWRGRSSLSDCFATETVQIPDNIRRGLIEDMRLQLEGMPPERKLELAKEAREAVETSSFTSASGITLHGWEPCPETGNSPDTDLVLWLQESEDYSAGSSVIGYDPAREGPVGIRLELAYDFPASFLRATSWISAASLARPLRAPPDVAELVARLERSPWSPRALTALARKATVLHEFGHILGLHHEFARDLKRRTAFPDLTDYIRAYPKPDPKISTFGTPYDASSIMMYGYEQTAAILALVRSYCYDIASRPNLKPEYEELCPLLSRAELRADYSSWDRYAISRLYQRRTAKPGAGTPFEQAMRRAWELLRRKGS
jgi:hypothetical protein